MQQDDPTRAYESPREQRRELMEDVLYAVDAREQPFHGVVKGRALLRGSLLPSHRRGDAGLGVERLRYYR